MQISNYNIAQITDLYIAIDKLMSTFRRRSVSYSIFVHTNQAAVINLTVNGKKGIVTKAVILVFNTELNQWELYAQEYKYILDSFSEIKVICQSILNRLRSSLNKI